MDVRDKVAIVTGASSGIGRAAARLLTQDGARVALVARSTDKLEALARELPGSLAVPADMTQESQIRAMVATATDHFGRVDILVNSAGRGYDAPIETTRPATFRQVFELDVVGPLIAMQAVIPIMRKQGGGVIVNISSGTALMTLPNMGGYSSLKRALSGLSLTAREELQGDHISVSVLYPYITATDFEKNTIKEDAGAVWEDAEDDHELPPPDSAEYAAEKILECIRGEQAQVFAHDWMRHIG
jgi:NAD(P)-dependent dehydrogenase (short-subunit alcohol dehydrogenase family)